MDANHDKKDVTGAPRVPARWIRRAQDRAQDLIQSVRSGRLRRPALWLGGALVVLGVLGFLVAPPLLRPVLEREASAALGRQVTLERLSLNPFSLSATLHGLKIAEAGGQGEFVTVGEAYANLSSTSLFRLAPVLKAVRVSGLRLNLVRVADNQYNFNDLIERFRPAPDAPETPPARFALYNIELQDGDIRFDDRVTGQQHRVADLRFGLPFVSNLPGRVDTFVTPHLAATVNGSPFALDGELKPFADRREAHLHLQLEPQDLTRYLAYLPVKLPLALKQAELGLDLRLLWSEGATQTLALQGEVGLGKLRVETLEGGELLQLERLRLALKQVEPLAQPMRIELAAVEIERPRVRLERDAQGTLSIARLLDVPAQPSTKKAAPATPPPLLQLDQLRLTGGGVHWQDAAVPGGYSGGARDIELQLANFDLAGTRKASLDLALLGEHDSRLTLKGSLQGTQAAELQATVATLPLGQYLPYLRGVVRKGEVQGMLEGEAHVQLTRENEALKILVDRTRAKLSDLRLSEPGQRQPVLQVASVELGGLSVDLQEQTVRLEEFRSQGGRATVVRGKDGELNLLRLIQGDKVADVAREVAAEIRSKEWGVTVAQANIDNWAASMEDRSVDPAVRMQLDPIALELANLSSLGKTPGELKLSTRVNRKGSARIEGRLNIAPLRGDMRVGLEAVDVLMAQPYVDDVFRVLITRGQLNAKGQLKFDLADLDKPQFSYAGDLALHDFNSLDTLNDTDFLRWKRFGLVGTELQLSPLRFHAKELVLDAFYTRLILDQQGRFNLRELRAHDEDAPPATSAPATATAGDKPLDLDLRIDRLVFDQGDVNYSDRFVRPNYDAHLLRVKGVVEGLSSDPASLATLNIGAALDGNAPVSINGKLNPLRQDRYLDLKAQVSDVDLTGVSTYSAKYVGYGITRGRLSMTLDYSIRDRKLSAQNQVFLDQLTFGDKVESPDAVDLPVKLGVALLKDSKGQIDLNLPISGSLDDPQFSVGGVIWKVIVNLFTKAITSPFSLLGSMFGGNAEELAFVDFAPGSATLSPAAEDKLKSVAHALKERPALTLDITGRADTAADTSGLKRELLEGKLRTIKAEAMVKRGESVAEVDRLVIAPEEREALLREAYKREKFEKPRNAIGMVRDLPAAETEKMILDHTEVRAEDLQALASRRASTIRNWFLAQGGIPQNRVFLLAASGEDKAKQGTRADFTLR